MNLSCFANELKFVFGGYNESCGLYPCPIRMNDAPCVPINGQMFAPGRRNDLVSYSIEDAGRHDVCGR